ncbi:MAG: GNAT family N-acetyltransferase [Candidatus Eremiobacteraeota bacterium]|nr:GNAT family N-acetyltransferase [Candidatus Eremiobacteraeota bacterium]
MVIQEACPSDCRSIIAIYDEKPPVPVNSQAPADQREHYAKRFREKAGEIGFDKSLCVLVARNDGGNLSGYLMLDLNSPDSSTGERRNVIYDYGIAAGASEQAILAPLLGKAEEISHAMGIKSLIIEIPAGSEKEMDLIGEMGFSPSLHRIIKKVEHHAIRRFTPDPYRVRKASEDDGIFILWLNSQCASFMMSHESVISREEELRRYLTACAELPMLDDEFLEGLIIEDTMMSKPVGYLLMKTSSRHAVTGHKLGCVQDMAIHPDYWGKRATQRIMRVGENLLHSRGIGYITGDISHENQRALKTALKSLGYQKESLWWMKRIMMREP